MDYNPPGHQPCALANPFPMTAGATFADGVGLVPAEPDIWRVEPHVHTLARFNAH